MRLAIVLPPREGFSPEAVGAIGLLVHRLSTPDEPIIGAPIAYGSAFADRRFLSVRRPVWPLWGPGRYAAGVAARLREVRPELIEVHNRPEVALALQRRFPAARLTLFLHNDPLGMRRCKTVRARLRLAARMQVICVSEALRRRFCEGLDPAPEVQVLPNCIDLSRLPGASQREKLILFAGRLVADKGADMFVAACREALPHLPGWRAEMIGADRFSPASPPTPFLEMLKAAAAKGGITQRGHLPHERVLEAMTRAAIVVVPSRWQEPFGMTALEAMAAGAALIVSPRPGLLEVVGEAALTARPEMPGELAGAILRLAGDDELRRALSQSGRERARQFDAGAARQRLEQSRAARMGLAPTVQNGHFARE